MSRETLYLILKPILDTLTENDDVEQIEALALMSVAIETTYDEMKKQKGGQYLSYDTVAETVIESYASEGWKLAQQILERI